jgi:hypothetical protein
MRDGHLRALEDGQVWRFALDASDQTQELFFERINEPLGPLRSLDSAFAASLLWFMSAGVDTLHLHGPVSRTLLQNLDEMQRVWAKWVPDTYRMVDVVADETVNDQPTGAGAISAFSGGVDASFTVKRHVLDPPGWHSAGLDEVVMVQGFDIGLDEPDVFASALQRATRMLSGLNLQVSQVRTSLQRLGVEWEHVFGLGVAAVLLLFQDRRRTGLIGSSEDYGGLVLPWGSTPVQDWMASTGAMQIRHDGAGFSRSEKLRALGDWPAALDNLRVCWQGPDHDRNCGRCEKCVRTMLNAAAVGLPPLGCFDQPYSRENLKALRIEKDAIFAEFASVLSEARRNGVSDRWTTEVEAHLRRQLLRSRVKATPAYGLARRARRGLRARRVAARGRLG